MSSKQKNIHLGITLADVSYNLIFISFIAQFES